MQVGLEDVIVFFLCIFLEVTADVGARHVDQDVDFARLFRGAPDRITIREIESDRACI